MKNKVLEVNFTQIPNILFDNWLPELEKGELKVLLYIMRRTYGFGKLKDTISFSQILTGITNKDGGQLDKGTGLGKETVTRSIKSLEKKGILTVNRNGRTNNYSLNLNYDSTIVELVPQSNQSSTIVEPKLVPQSNTQKKEKQSYQKKDSEQVAYTPKDYVSEMRNSDKPINRIIGIYFEKAKPNIPTKAIAQETFRRHLRPAKKLVAWTETEHTRQLLMNAFKKAQDEGEKNNFEFTLETVYKYLTK